MDEKKQSKEGCLVVAISVVVFAIVLGLALFLSSRESEAPITATQRFRARPGATRERAVALTTRKRADETEPLTAESPPEQAVTTSRSTRPTGASIRVRSLSRPEDEEELSATEREVHSALNALSPHQGIERLQATLRTAVTPAEKTTLHRALARLYMQIEPPDVVAAEKALDMAISNAMDQATRDALTLEQSQLYLQRGETGIALARLQTALETPGIDTPARMRLELAHAQAVEMTGDFEGAAAVYVSVSEKAAKIKDTASADTAEAVEISRLAVMRLTQLYRKQGMNEEADRLRDAYARGVVQAP